MKKHIKKIFISVLLVVSIIALPITKVDAGSNSILTENFEQNEYDTKNVEELIVIISEFDNYEEVNLYCFSALYEKADNSYKDLFSEKIFDNSEDLVVRKALLEICIEKNIPLAEDKLKKLMLDTNQDLSLRRFVLDYCCLQGEKFIPEIEKLIQTDVQGLGYNAMKKLYVISPDNALSYAKRAMENMENKAFDIQLAAVEIIADELHKNSTPEERLEYIEYCDTLLTMTDSEEKCALLLSAISFVNSEETLLYVIQSEKLSDFQKFGIVNNNRTMLNNIKESDVIGEYDEIISEALAINACECVSNISQNYSIKSTSNYSASTDTDCIQSSSILSSGGWGFGHAGLMYQNGFDANNGKNTIVHVGGSYDAIKFGNEADFLNGNDFLGYYNPKQNLTITERTTIMVTAYELYQKSDYINYTLVQQVDYTDTNKNGIVDYSEIENLRCDGFVEYCYEYNGKKIFYDEDYPDNWNISVVNSTTKRKHAGTNVTPEKQAFDYMTNMLGDLNADGSVTSADAQLAQQCAVAVGTYTQYQLFVADVDGNGTINSADARLILRYATGLETYFPADPKDTTNY